MYGNKNSNKNYIKCVTLCVFYTETGENSPDLCEHINIITR
jgi:hypothetical protein